MSHTHHSLLLFCCCRPRRAQMKAAKPQVSAKGIRLSSDIERDQQEGAGGRRRGPQEITIVNDWERNQGLKGKVNAMKKVQKERAEKARQAQGLRSGIIQLRSRNLTYVAESAWSNHDLESIMGATPAGPIVARAEYLASSFGGSIPMGKRAIEYVQAYVNCSNLQPWPKKGVSTSTRWTVPSKAIAYIPPFMSLGHIGDCCLG